MTRVKGVEGSAEVPHIVLSAHETADAVEEVAVRPTGSKITIGAFGFSQ